MAQFLQAAPILVTCDLDAAMRRYRLLGFEVSTYTGPMADPVTTATRSETRSICTSPWFTISTRSGLSSPPTFT